MSDDEYAFWLAWIVYGAGMMILMGVLGARQILGV